MKIKLSELENRIPDASDLFIHKFDGSLQNHVFINMDKVHSYYTWSETIKEQLREEMNQYLFEMTGTYQYLNPGSSQQMVRALTELLGVPHAELNDGYGKVSVSQKVIKNLRSEYKSVFTTLYLSYLEEKSITTNLKPFLKHDNGGGYKNNDGDRIVAIPVYYDISNTYRFQANNPPLQNISRDMTDIISAPKNWVVLQVDSKQIEPSLYYTLIVKDPLMNWLIEQYQDIYYAIADYCLRDDVTFHDNNLYLHGSITREDRDAFKTMANAGTYGAGKKKIMEEARSIIFEQYRTKNPALYESIRKISRYRKALANPKLPQVVRNNYQAQLINSESYLEQINRDINKLYEGFTERVINHPQRKEFIEREKDLIKKGKREFTSPFNDTCVASGDLNYLVRCAINNPLQLSVSQLSAQSVCAAFEMIYETGTESHILYSLNKHDQDIYVVHKSLAEVAMDAFKELREYEIEDWRPIKSDYSMGLNYER